MFNKTLKTHSGDNCKYNLSSHISENTYKFINVFELFNIRNELKPYTYKITVLYEAFIYMCQLFKTGFSIIHSLSNTDHLSYLIKLYCTDVENYSFNLKTEIKRRKLNVICLNNKNFNKHSANLYTSNTIDIDNVSDTIANKTYPLPLKPNKKPISPFQFIDDFVSQSKEHIFGQTKHLSSMSSQLLNVFDNKYKKPIANYLLCGPSGTGKTELAHVLADYVYKKQKNLNITDMSDFTEPHSISKLLGTAPGYVGSEEGGSIVKDVIDNPESVFLFDELEKAHESIYTIFLQLLDEGILTDSKGVQGDFTKSIIIFTSNLGSKILAGMREMDFNEYKYRSATFEAVRMSLRPELINRLDNIVIFNPLQLFSLYYIYKKFVSPVTKTHLNKFIKFLIVWFSRSLTKGSRLLLNNINMITLSLPTPYEVLVDYNNLFKCLEILKKD